MLVYFISFGLLFAMIGIVAPQAFTLWRARRTGILRRQGHNGARIDRATDPERFDLLYIARRNRLTIPSIILAVAFVVCLWEAASFIAVARRGPEPFDAQELAWQRCHGPCPARQPARTTTITVDVPAENTLR
jgi:hypothetical protein